MKNIIIGAVLLLFITACVNNESFNQDSTYLKQNALYLSFYGADTSYLDNDQLGYASFTVLENKKSYNELPTATKDNVFVLFPLFHAQITYIVLPIDPSYSKNTFVLTKKTGAKDTLSFDRIRQKIIINEKETGYEMSISRPHLLKSSLDTISSYFETSNRLLYIAFKKS